jgi:hypothetical protein
MESFDDTEEDFFSDLPKRNSFLAQEAIKLRSQIDSYKKIQNNIRELKMKLRKAEDCWLKQKRELT